MAEIALVQISMEQYEAWMKADEKLRASRHVPIIANTVAYSGPMNTVAYGPLSIVNTVHLEANDEG